ncbi:MAG TPA: DUF2993 domain-containing protein [Rubrobacteraceae bacterium]|nr:DUF2993 domain-containing protein [Rubrobacteraceae bacterium]
MLRTTFFIGSVVVLAIVGSYVLLPALLERLVADRLQEQLGLRSAPEVELRGEPPPRPPGSFSGGSVTARGAEFDGVRPSTTVVDLGPFNLDLPASIAAGAPRSEEPPSGTLRVELPEEEVARLARREADVPVRSVDLRKGEVVVGSEVRALGARVPLSVRGELSFRGGALRFEPRGLSAAGVPVPDELADRLLAEAGFEYIPQGLAYGAEITGAEVREGRLILNGELERIPLGGGGA